MKNQGEPVGTCGCRLIRIETGLTMQDCPLHANAEGMRELLAAAPDFGGEPQTAFGREYREWQTKARALLRAVEGKVTP